MLYRVYIDEAGDRGFSPGSSRFFVVSAAIVPDSDDRVVRQEFAAVRKEFGRSAAQPLHFRSLSHSKRMEVAHRLTTMPVATLVSVVVCKASLRDPANGRSSFVTQPDPLYLYSLRLLMERVSWYCDERSNDGQAVVTLAHIRRFKAEKLDDYRQALAARPDVQIRWRVFEHHPWRIDQPVNVELLQLADTVASAVFKAVEPDEYGRTEGRYLDELTSKLYRRAGGSILSYGLKVFPAAAGATGGSLAHLLKYERA